MKTIKISDEAWEGLMKLKIEHRKRSLDEVIKTLLEKEEVHKLGKNVAGYEFQEVEV